MSPVGLCRLLGISILALLVLPGGSRGQTACDLVGSNYFRQLATGSGQITFVSQPVIRCRDGTRIEADSAEIYEARNYSQFFGSVEFRDSATVLSTDRAHFFSREGRLQAWGSVVLTDREEGSRITGDTLVYLRPIEARPTEQITVTGRRPHATLYPAPVDPDSVPEDEPAEDARGEGAGVAPGDTAGAPGGEEARDRPLRDLRDQLERPAPEVRDSAGAEPSDSVAVQVPADSLRASADSAEVRDPPEGAGERPPSAPEDTIRTPYEVDADRIFLEGDRYFRATGTVEVTRDSLEAYGDSVEYDQRAGRLFITESARLLAAEYVLLGRVITLVLPAGEISEIVSRENAELTGEDLRLTAPEIRLYMRDGQAQRLVAVHRIPGEDSDSTAARTGAAGDSAAAPPPRPRAVATQFLLVADSIEAQTPEEVLERVVASGSARGESLARDSLNTPETPEIARRDWLEGDTVVALFEPDTSGIRADTAGPGYRLNRVTATGRARSLYRMEPTDTAQAQERLALNYVEGRRISIQMEEGEVREMEVQGQTRGVYLEPVRRARPDTATTAAASRREGGGGP